MTNHSWLDFNDAAEPQDEASPNLRDTVHAALIAQLDNVLHTLLPAGKVQHGAFVVGDVLGSPGRSLDVVLEGDKAGLWTDRAENRGGDIFDLIAAHHRLHVQQDFARVLEKAQALLGYAAARPAPKPKRRETPIDELGPATAKWDYRDVDGTLLAVVYRYDPPSGKEFRPWDVKRRKASPPSPRPLYNLPGFAANTHIVLVEGEKCAQALIDAGIGATTAMHGANAPIDKTDWSPLAGKQVLVWPDRDKPGWEYAVAAAEAALAAGALSVAVLTPPDDKPEGWDAADALKELRDETVKEPFDVIGFLKAGQRTPIKPPAPVSDSSIPFGTTDDGLALAFTHRHGDDWRYCAGWSQWLTWTGQRWNPDAQLYVFHLARQIGRAAALQAEKAAERNRLASASTVSAIERLARADPIHATSVAVWDNNPWVLNTPGGIVDLQTGQVRSHDRLAHLTRLATASLPILARTSVLWQSFMHDVTGGDVALQGYLQRAVGYCLTGVTSEHALFFLYGTGANGKSVFVNVVASILGDYAMHAPMDTFMESRGERHPTELAALRGARFVAAQETEQGRRWNESKLKAITGGDKIMARFMRQDFFEYTPQFKLLIAGNHKPAIRNVDEAIKRRLHLVPFTVTIPEERRDLRLTEKLLADRDLIFGWALRGCLDWQQSGLRPPRCVLEATEEYFEEEDGAGEFLEDECNLVPGARTPIAEIFERWREYRERRGEFVGSSRWLVQQLLARGLERTRVTDGVKALAGVSLKPRSHLLR